MKIYKLYHKLKFFILLALIISSIAAFLNNYLLPIKLKNVLETAISNTIDKPVSFENLGFNLFKGITIDNMVIFETEKKEKILLKAKLISFNPLLFALIQKKIILSQFSINNLEATLERNQEGKFDLIEKLAAKFKNKQPKTFIFAATDLSLKNSTITLKDNFLPEPQTTIIENINTSARFYLPAEVRFNFKSTLKDSCEEIAFNGTYYLLNKKLIANLNCLDLKLHRFSGYFKDKSAVSIEDDNTDIAADITLDFNKELSIDGTGYFNKLKANFISLMLDGNLVIRGKANYDLKNKTLTKTEGNIIIRENNLKGLLYVDSMEKIEGVVNFTEEGLFIENLSAHIKNMPLNIEGYLKNFRYPQLKISLTSDLKLQQAISQLPSPFNEKLKDIELKGDTILRLDAEGTLKEFWSLDFTGKAQLTDAAIKSISPPLEIKNISSKINFSKDTLSIDNLNLEFKNTYYTATAALSNFTEPIVDFKLTSQNLFGKGKIKFAAQAAEIQNITGKYKGVDFEINGRAFDYNNPMLNIHAKLTSTLENLQTALPASEQIIQKLKLSGHVTSEIYLEGKAAEPINGFAKIKVTSPQINADTIKISNINLDGQLQQKKLLVDKLSADAYDGKLLLNAKLDIQNPKQAAFEADFNASAINLSKLIKDTALKDKKIKGTGELTCSLAGNFNNPASFSGGGQLKITDGYLWEVPTLKKLSGFFNLPGLEEVIFTQASGNYQIQNKQLSTQDLTLSSEQVAMLAKGAAGFDRGLDFLIETEFSQAYHQSLVEKGLTAPIFLEKLAKYAMNVRVTGTIDKPQFSYKPISVEDILKEEILKEDLFKNLEKIFR